MKTDFEIPFDIKNDLVYCQRALTSHILIHQVNKYMLNIVYDPFEIFWNKPFDYEFLRMLFNAIEVNWWSENLAHAEVKVFRFNVSMSYLQNFQCESNKIFWE